MQKLEPQHQELIKKLGSEFIDDFAQVMIEKRQSIRQKLIDGIDGNRVKVVSLSKKEQKKLLKAGKMKLKSGKMIMEKKAKNYYANTESLLKNTKKSKKIGVSLAKLKRFFDINKTFELVFCSGI